MPIDKRIVLEPERKFVIVGFPTFSLRRDNINFIYECVTEIAQFSFTIDKQFSRSRIFSGAAFVLTKSEKTKEIIKQRVSEKGFFKHKKAKQVPDVLLIKKEPGEPDENGAVENADTVKKKKTRKTIDFPFLVDLTPQERFFMLCKFWSKIYARDRNY